MQHNDTILSLEYCNLVRKCNETVEQWTGQIRVKGNEYKYKQRDRRLREQFINGINHQVMTEGMAKEFTAIKDI